MSFKIFVFKILTLHYVQQQVVNHISLPLSVSFISFFMSWHEKGLNF